MFFFRSRKHGLELNHCVKFQHFPPTSPYIVKRKPDPCQPRWEDGSSASLANHFAATIWGSFQKIRPVCTICRETKYWRAETFVSAMHLKGHYGRLHITEGAKNTHSTEDLDNRETYRVAACLDNPKWSADSLIYTCASVLKLVLHRVTIRLLASCLLRARGWRAKT